MFKDVKADLYWTGEMGHVSPGMSPGPDTPKGGFGVRLKSGRVLTPVLESVSACLHYFPYITPGMIP